MKKVIIASLMLVTSMSQAASIAGFKNLLPNGIYQGILDASSTCQIKATWLSDTELRIETSTRYKNQKADKDVVIFSDAKEAYFTHMRSFGKETLAEVEQSEVIFKDGDYEVIRSESIQLELNARRQIEVISVRVVEMDGENDPLEPIYVACGNIKKIK